MTTPQPNKPLRAARPCVVMAPPWAHERWYTVCRACGEQKAYTAYAIKKGATCTRCHTGLLDTSGWLVRDGKRLWAPSEIAFQLGLPENR